MHTLYFWVLITTFIALDAVYWRALDQRLRSLRGAPIWRAMLAVVMSWLILYIFPVLTLTPWLRGSSGPIPMELQAIGYLWHFLGLPVAMGLLALITAPQWLGRAMTFLIPGGGARNSARSLDAAQDGNATSSIESASPAIGNDPLVPPLARSAPSRRQILAAAALCAPPAATWAVGVISVRQMYARRVRRFELAFASLPPALDGLSIAHVSDTHIGKFFHPDHLPALAHEINALNADVIAFTGDLIDLALEDLPHGVGFLRSLRSRCGLAICEGNHDLMVDRGVFEETLREMEMPFIVGQQMTLSCSVVGGREHPVQFLAVPWNQYDYEMAPAVQYLAPAVDPGAFPILLAHHPHSFDTAADLGTIPLVLSGHTHGGQLMLSDTIGAGPLRFRYVQGLYRKNNSALIVSNGLGNWFPLRVNAPAEIVHITLRKA